MALYVDSANLEDISTLTRTFPLAGVTMNPTLLLTAYQGGQHLEAEEILRQLVGSFTGTIFIQPSISEENSAYQEALTYLQIDAERIIPKIPITQIGVRVAQRLRNKGYRVAFTAVTTVAQAYTASMVGADFIIPYYNRLRRSGVDPHERILQMAKLFHMQQLKTRIMAASIKSSVEAADALLAGAHDLTVPPHILLEMVSDHETEEAVKRFEQDIYKLKQKPL